MWRVRRTCAPAPHRGTAPYTPPAQDPRTGWLQETVPSHRTDGPSLARLSQQAMSHIIVWIGSKTLKDLQDQLLHGLPCSRPVKASHIEAAAAHCGSCLAICLSGHAAMRCTLRNQRDVNGSPTLSAIRFTPASSICGLTSSKALACRACRHSFSTWTQADTVLQLDFRQK